MTKLRIAIFASGAGTNAENIMRHFAASPSFQIDTLISNNPNALAIEKAHRLKVPCVVFSKKDFFQGTSLLETLSCRKIDFIVLAGFLWLIPKEIIHAYPEKIINIHPALLPKYGGKGMYGMNVHRTVIEAGEVQSGISIHLVNEKYDEGQLLFQATCPVLENDTPESLANRVHTLEYEHYPIVLNDYFNEKLSSEKIYTETK